MNEESDYLELPERYDFLLEDREDRELIQFLIKYLIFGEKPETSPRLWQDTAMFVRYAQRDLLSFDDWRFHHAMEALVVFRAKYIVNHLKKNEISDVLSDFFHQADMDFEDETMTLYDLFEKKFHASIDDVILTQEKQEITKARLKDFDKLFNYPCWIEFDAEARDEIFNRIMNGEMTDEQIDYFLGASDNIQDYDKWLPVMLHIMKTTHKAHVFWTAGDILAIIRRAVPEDKASQKWFDDLIFETVWPRVGSAWPILNYDLIDFEDSEDAKLLDDAIGWVETITDLRDRVKELEEAEYRSPGHVSADVEFSVAKDSLLYELEDRPEGWPTNIQKIMHLFMEACEAVRTEKNVAELRKIADKKVLPEIERFLESRHEFVPKDLRGPEGPERTQILSETLNEALDHSERYVKQLNEEAEKLKKLVE